jgi:hypothetical protein
MSQQIQLSKDTLKEILIPPYWDPIPPWLELNKDLLIRFTQLEIEFKTKELQIQQEKLQEFGKLIG